MANESQVKLMTSALAPSTNQPQGAPDPFSMAGEDPFIAQLKSQLTAQSGIVSSAQADSDALINKAIAGVQKGAVDNAASITLQYDRQKGYQSEANTRLMTSTQEAQRGFGQNTALLAQINDQGQKALNDLEQRKQELILSGNAAAANQVSGLQVQQAQMLLQNRQQVFQNLISIAGVGMQAGGLQLQKQQFQQQQAQFDRTMQMKIGETALQYGIKLEPNDTFESVINKAYPLANEMARLQLDDMKLGMAVKRSQIALNNAQAAKASPNPGDIEAMVRGIQVYGQDSEYAKNVFSILGSSGNLGAAQSLLEKINKPQNFSDSDLNQKAMALYATNFDPQTGTANIDAAIGKIDGDGTILNKARAKEITRMYFNAPIQDSGTMDFIKAFGWNLLNTLPGGSGPFSSLGATNFR